MITWLDISNNEATWRTVFWTAVGAIGTVLAFSFAFFKEFLSFSKLVSVVAKKFDQKEGSRYVYRILIINKGLFAAHDVEAMVEGIIEDGIVRKGFLPLPLGWTHGQAYPGHSSVIRNIHRNQSAFLDVCEFIYYPSTQFILTVQAGREIAYFSQLKINAVTDIKIVLYQRSGQNVRIVVRVKPDKLGYPRISIMN